MYKIKKFDSFIWCYFHRCNGRCWSLNLIACRSCWGDNAASSLAHFKARRDFLLLTPLLSFSSISSCVSSSVLSSSASPRLVYWTNELGFMLFFLLPWLLPAVPPCASLNMAKYSIIIRTVWYIQEEQILRIASSIDQRHLVGAKFWKLLQSFNLNILANTKSFRMSGPISKPRHH